MQQAGRGCPLQLADHAVSFAARGLRVDDHVVGRGCAQADSLGRVALAQPEPIAAVLLNVAALGQNRQQVRSEEELAEALAATEGQFKGRTSQMAGENGQIARG